MTVRVQGVEGHSSRPDRGVNAVEAAGELLRAFEPIRTELRRNARHAELLELPVQHVQHRLDPGGGEVVNIVPNHCVLSTDLRLAPGAPLEEVTEPVREAVAALDRRLKSIDARAGASFVLDRSYPAFEMPPESPLARLIRSTLPDPKPIAVSFATEAAALMQAGVATIVCGPGSIEQAHRPDESVDRAELAAAVPWLEGVVRRIRVDAELG